MAAQLWHGSIRLLVVAVVAAACQNSRPHPRPPSENRAPLGFVEAPVHAASVEPRFVVRGWAADDRGIRAVRVFVDTTLVGLAEFVLDRSDVSAAYPELRHGTDRHGWEKVVAVDPGAHTLRVDVIDVDGLVTDLGQRDIVVLIRVPDR